jgi:hypothetical protein
MPLRAGNLTVMDLSNSAAELEKAGKIKDVQRVPDTFKQMKYEFSRLKKYKGRLRSEG